MAYKILSFEGFVQEFKSVSLGAYPRKFCFVLGSGASKTSGIKTGEELVDIWDKELEIRNSEDHLQWKKQNGITEENKYNFYSIFYERRFEKDNGKRYRDGYSFLESIMEKAHPSCGYVYLALMMAKTINNVVITTNFDHLTEDCIVRYAQTLPMVVGHENLAHYITQPLSRPTVIKIHRDLLLNPINKTVELNKLYESWEKALDSIFSVYHPIFIGYAGNDKSVMDFLYKNIDKFNNDEWACPYWLIYGKQQIPKNVKDFLKKTNGYLIRHNGFDQVLTQLSFALNIELPDENTFIQKTKEQYKSLLNSVESIIHENSIMQSNKQSITTINANLINNISTEKISDLYSKFIMLFSNQNYSYAFDIINNLTELYPDNSQYHNNSGITLYAMKRYDEALVEMQKAVELEPDNARYHNSLGVILHAMKRYDEALVEKQKAVELEPDSAEYHDSLGITLHKMKRYDEALVEKQKAVELEPDSAEYHDSLGITLHKMKRYDEALVEKQKAVELEPDNAEYHNSLGVTLHEMERYDEALVETQKTVKLENNLN